MSENLLAVSMKYIGLLTHEQKQAGYFVSQDEDFIYVWRNNNGKPCPIAIFLYDTATVKEIRESAQKDLDNGNTN